MNPFAGLFKRGPDPIQLSDWLENMNKSFLEWGVKILSGDKSSWDMLVCFTLINATGSAYNLLHAPLSIASGIGTVYGELRAYFECLWQLDLLSRYESAEDRDKTSKLYVPVSLRLEKIMTSLFSENPNVKRCLESTVGEPYRRLFCASAKEYLTWQRKGSKQSTGSFLQDNVQFLASAIQRATSLREREQQSVVHIMSQDMKNALHMRFLTEFDFPRCKVFPNFFYQ
jgi:hypothetical protein